MGIKNRLSVLLVLLCLSCNGFAQLKEYDNRVAAVWSVVLPGGGHFYKQNFNDGMFFLVAETLSGLGSLALTVKAPPSTDGVNSGAMAVKLIGVVSLIFFVPIKIVDIASAADCVEALPEEEISEFKLYPVYSLKNNAAGLTLSYTF